jgi:dihydrofolate synthase/folylpolyglutamate synthase
MFKTFEEAINYLEGFLPPDRTSYKTTRALRLERITYLLKLLGDPHKRIKSIHIGGTSGKGSVAYLLSQLLSGQGYKVGLHTNPHLQLITERAQINGQPMSKQRFVDYVNNLQPLIRQVSKDIGLGEPSYFEILVAISLDYFAKEKVDIAIVEVGLGGTLDATNVITPLVSIITNVSLDHTEILGKTVQKIATDKAGIIKKGVPVITEAQQPSVRKIISEKAADCGSEVYLLGKDFSYEMKTSELSGNAFNFSWGGKEYSNLKLSAHGAFQVENASLALSCIHLLRSFSFPVNLQKLISSLKNVKVPGRFELIQRKPLVILDSAHNPTKIKALTYSLTMIFPKQKFVFLIGFKEDKDIVAMLRVVMPHSKAFVVTEFGKVTDMGRHLSAPAREVGKALKTLKFSGLTIVEKDCSKALNTVKKIASNDDIMVVTGSLYLVGEIRDLF